MHILYYVAVVLAAGLFVAKFTGKLKLPNVTGYLIALSSGQSTACLLPACRVRTLS